jgi:CheY-like chemotaxis protein
MSARDPTCGRATVSNKTTGGPVYPVSGAEVVLKWRRSVAVRRLLDAPGNSSKDDNMPIDLKPLLPQEDNIIFVVDGDEVIRSALHFILDDQHQTHSFASLGPAFASAVNAAPGLVLLGVDFLRNNGEAVMAEIVMRLRGAKILIVANSANDPLAQASLKWGAHDVLGKPITFDSVHGRVDALLGRLTISPALLGLLPRSVAW